MSDHERDPKEVWISASQVETRKLCNRKWHFNSVLKLPRPESPSTSLGTVLHKCYEYVTQGLDPFAGEWDIAFAKHERAEKSALVRQIVEAAMQTGAVTFEPKAKCEHKFEIRYLRPSGYTVVLNGSIDCIISSPLSAHVIDYKNLKSLSYAKDDVTVKEALQMRTYAIVALHEQPNLSTVVMEHRSLCTHPKTPGKYKQAINIATAAEIREWEAEFLAKADEMVAARISGETPPGVPNEEGACEAFGGCEFASICSGRNTIDEYRRINTTQPPQPTQPAETQGTAPMNLMSWKKTATQAPVAAPDEAVATTPEAANAKLAMPSHAIDPVAALLNDAPAPVVASVEPEPAAPVKVSVETKIEPAVETVRVEAVLFREGDRVTDGKRFGTYTGDNWVRWEGNTKRSKVDDLMTLKYAPASETPKNEIRDEKAEVVTQWVEGEVASDVSASKGSEEPPPVLESEAAEVHPEVGKDCVQHLKDMVKESLIITLYIGCVPRERHMTTNQLLNDKEFVGENYWAKNAFTRRDELLFKNDREVRIHLESEAFEHIVHVDDSPDAKAMAALLERVADRVIRAVK